MKTIWKYTVVQQNDIISMPEGAEILTAQLQYDRLCVWALVDPEKELVPRNIVTIGTGWGIENEDVLDYKHISTYQDGSLVFHVFEVTAKKIGE